MKELLISNCEKNFILKCLTDFTRLDGRAFDEFRELKIEFGRDWGCCLVSLGETKVLAQVSCEIQQPKLSRPNEGLININIELSPMGAPQFQAGRQSELSVHLNRLLEKCIKDSKAVDLEALCIKLNEKVWSLRVDINVLNHEGNLLDAASIAALTALSHFRRPDVTSDGEQIIIHTYEQRDPIRTVVHHYPLCVTYATFHQGSVCVADPTLLEEGVSEAQLVLAINSYKEICTIHLGGSALVNQNIILQCISKGAARAFEVVTQIKQVMEKDLENRKENKKNFFQYFLNKDSKIDIGNEQLISVFNKWNVKNSRKKEKQNLEENSEISKSLQKTDNFKELLKKTVILVSEGSAALLNKNEVENVDDSSDEDIKIIEPPAVQNIVIDDSNESSEEDDVVLLTSEMNSNHLVPVPVKNKKRKMKK